jgi:perosamine synthetase
MQAEIATPAVAAQAATLTYKLFDPSGCGFPEPRVPLLPMLSSRGIGPSRQGEFVLVGAGRRHRGYTRGRYALYDAYRLCGVGERGALLAPAYHCRTMLDPAISLGAELLLYPVRDDLSPDLGGLARLLARARQPVRAMLLTHYFGFAQDAAEVSAFCRAHDIALIEDCSHALFNRRSAERLGQHGRYTIASPYKLFPCEEGGMLIPATGAALPGDGIARSGWKAELRVLVSALRRKLARRHSAAVDTRAEEVESELAALARVPLTRAAERTAALPGTSGMYVSSEQPLAGPRTARWLMKLCSVDHVARRRRDNYLRWRDAVTGLPHCRPLFGQLPDDSVPYMFPLLIEHPQAHFYALKRLGMPIWRWDEMAVSDCAVATHYGRHLLHLPCHQAVSEDELAWMIAAVSAVMRRVSIGG